MPGRSINVQRLPRTVEIARVTGDTTFTYVDQRLLPYELTFEQTRDWWQVVDAIKTLAVRGAPAIGIAGAAAVALWAASDEALSLVEPTYRARMLEVAGQIASARPTAVNLKWAVERAVAEIERAPKNREEALLIADDLAKFVKRLIEEDELTNRAIGSNGADLLVDKPNVLTHCNAGSLATAFFGTALGVVYAAAERGCIERVYADETRPVGQGARLTAWELARAGVPVTLICDDMAASLMAAGKVDAVIVGADRIAANGDTANKIGTYGVAVLAHEHGIPFYVAAPASTIDFSTASGDLIPIEQRPASEVLARPIEGVSVYNPAFDVTPARYISRIITENGVFKPEELSQAI